MDSQPESLLKCDDALFCAKRMGGRRLPTTLQDVMGSYHTDLRCEDVRGGNNAYV